MIVGLGHYSRTGKDTFANYLIEECEKLGIKAIKRSFAWKLKQITHDLYAWAGLREPEFYETDEGAALRNVKTAIGLTPIETWVKFGTDAVRQNVYQNTWLDYLLKTKVDADVLIIPDVRFPNEAEAVKEGGGWLLKVVRPGFEPRQTVADLALCDYLGWDDVIGDEDIRTLCNEAKRYAAKLKQLEAIRA